MEENAYKSSEWLGEKLGSLFSYFLFTTILYLILTFTRAIPTQWTYAHVMLITVGVCAVGLTLKELLK